MKNLKEEIENLARKYKVLRLQEREILRRNRENNSQKIILMNEIITEIESILGYSVSINSDNKSSSIQDRLDAIEG